MSYGIVVKNAAGEDIFGGPLFWIRQEPLTTFLTRADHQASGLRTYPAAAAARLDPFGNDHWFRWSQTAQADQTVDHYLTAGFVTPPNSNQTLPMSGFNAGELAFFRLDSNGVVAVTQIFNTLPELPAGNVLHVVSWGTTTPLPCYICSTSPGSPSGTYGFRVWGADGTPEFDSRQSYPRITDHLYVSKATIVDILENDAVHDLALSEPTPAPMIACPLWAHGHFGQNVATDKRVARVRLRQLDLSTLRMDRVGEPNSGGTTYYARYTHDAMITVAQ